MNEVITQYTEQGYDCIPLKPNTKEAASKNWTTRTPSYQWRGAPEGANFGLRAGNGRAFIDCDNKKNPETFTNISNWLEGLGHKPGSYPVIQTASGIGRHIYVNFTGQLFGSAKNLSASIGTGEFRYSKGAYVAAPPSIVKNGTYQILEGDISQLPTLDIKDIAALVKVRDGEKPAPRMSEKAYSLAMGHGLKHYPSDSEAEAALVLSLVNSHFEDHAIKHIFDTFPCAGHYRNAEKYKTEAARQGYLSRTIKNARDYAVNESPTRRAIRELQELAERAAWKRATDKLVFLAHTELAYKAGKLEYYAASRDLAIGAGVGRDTALNANRRLVKDKLLTLLEPGNTLKPARFAFDVDKLPPFPRNAREGMVGICPSGEVIQGGKILDLDTLEAADAFRNGKKRLGRRAGIIYKLLFGDSLTETEIAKRTGAHIKTIRRTLKKLATVKDYKTGELLEMVTQDEGGCWHSNVVDLEVLEAIYGTRGAKEKQRDDYERERRDHRKALQLGALAKLRKTY